MFITLEPHGIFFIKCQHSWYANWHVNPPVFERYEIAVQLHPCMQNADKGLPSIILAGQGILVKILITLRTAWYILIKLCILIHFNIMETHVCKPIIRLFQDFFVAKPSHCFAYLCLDNIKMYKNPLSYRTYFRTDVLKHSVQLPVQYFQF